jgi:hypothetical protein
MCLNFKSGKSINQNQGENRKMPEIVTGRRSSVRKRNNEGKEAAF